MLYTFFRPAVAITCRLRFAEKLGLMGVLFLVPLVGMTYFLDKQIKKDINFAMIERVGIRQILPARQLLEILQEHRRTSQIMRIGDEEARQRLPSLTKNADATFKRLGEISASGGVPAKMVEEYLRLNNLWKELEVNVYQNVTEEMLAKYDVLIKQVASFIQITADYSNLSLDPEMDSYYLVEAIAIHLPNLVDKLEQFRGLGFIALRRHAMTVAERIELNVLQKLFASEFENLKSALDSAMGVNDELSRTLQAARMEAEVAAGYILGAGTPGILNGDLTIDPAVFIERDSVAITALYKLFDQSAQQLDGLLAARIERSKANRDAIFFGTGVVLLVVLYLFAGMFFSVLGSLTAIRAGAERLARGDLSRRVDSHSQDEMRDVGDAVNSVAETLRKFTRAQLDMARAHDKGRIWDEMLANVFPGVYGDIARKLNAMVKGHIEVQKQFVDLMVAYANGRFEARMVPLPAERKPISDAASRLRGILQSAHEAAKETLRIKIALDNTSSAVMMADAEGVIRYQNKACSTLLQRSENDFRKQFPGFSARCVEGANLDQFHKTINFQRGTLANLKGEHRTQIQIGDRRIRLIANSIADEEGTPLGTVVEWHDVTAEMNGDMTVILEATAASDPSIRPN